MKFEEVMPYLREGKKAHREIWETKYVGLFGKTLYQMCTDKYKTILKLRMKDIMAEDWHLKNES